MRKLGLFLFVSWGCSLGAAPVFAGGSKEVIDEESLNKKPVVLVANASSERTDDDETIMDVLVENIIQQGNYNSVKTNTTLGDGVAPTPTDFSAEENALEPLYVLTGQRSEGEDLVTYTVTLWNYETGDLMVTDQLQYEQVDEVSLFASTLLTRLFFLVPPPKILKIPEDISWKLGRFYLTFAGEGVFRWYDGSVPIGTIDYFDYSFTAPRLGFDWQFAMLAENRLGLSVGLEAGLTRDVFSFAYYKDEEYYKNIKTEATFFNFTGEIPILMKLNWYPSHFMLSAYGGGYYFFSVGALPMAEPFGSLEIKEMPIGLTCGLDVGMKVGKGILSLYGRYSYDFGRTSFLFESSDISDFYPDGLPITYRRQSVSVGLSYRLGLWKRPQNTVMEIEGGW